MYAVPIYIIIGMLGVVCHLLFFLFSIYSLPYLPVAIMNAYDFMLPWYTVLNISLTSLYLKPGSVTLDIVSNAILYWLELQFSPLLLGLPSCFRWEIHCCSNHWSCLVNMSFHVNSGMTLQHLLFANRRIVLSGDLAQPWGCPWQTQDVVQRTKMEPGIFQALGHLKTPEHLYQMPQVFAHWGTGHLKNFGLLMFTKIFPPPVPCLFSSPINKACSSLFLADGLFVFCLPAPINSIPCFLYRSLVVLAAFTSLLTISI